VLRGISPTPASTGAKVRTIGTKRAITTVFGPCFSKQSFVRSTYSCLKILGSVLLNSCGPMRDPNV
jgi:hypothetical protein